MVSQRSQISLVVLAMLQRFEGSVPTVMIHNSLALLFFIKHVTDNILYCCLIR